MYGDKAFELIKELYRSGDTIQPFDDDKIRLVYEEMRMLCDKISTAMHSTFDVETNNFLAEVKLEKAALERNQRCLLAYLLYEGSYRHPKTVTGWLKLCSDGDFSIQCISWNRMQQIRQMRWEFGSILPADIKENLSDSELSWFSNYSKSLAMYMKSIGPLHGLNLTQYIKPPKKLYVEVRSLVDYGKLELDDGEVLMLRKNSQHLMPRSQSEPLIRQGILEHMES